MTKRPKKIDGVSLKEKKSDDFFSELDNKRSKFSIFWFFSVLIFALIFAFLVYGALQLKRENVDLGLENFGEETAVDNFADRLKNISTPGETTIVFDSNQFVFASAVDSADFPLANCRYEIDKDSLWLVGKIKNSIIFWPIRVKLEYSAVGNKFIFLVSPKATENIVVFGETKSKIEETINQNLNQNLELSGFVAKNISTKKDRIEFRVIKSLK